MKTTTVKFSQDDIENLEIVRKHYSFRSMTAVLSFLLQKESKLIKKA